MKEKGFALIIAMVVIVVLTILGISGVNQATRELREVLPFTDYHSLLECAISAINYTAGRLQRVNVTNISLDDVEISTNPNLIIKTAHYGQDGTFTIQEVKQGEVEAGKATSSIAIVTNWIGELGGGGTGTPYAMVVLCRDGNGNEQEINFVFKYLTMF